MEVWMLEMQVSGFYEGAQDESHYILYAAGGARLTLLFGRMAWSKGSEAVARSFWVSTLVNPALGGFTGCVIGAENDNCVRGAMAGALIGAVAGKVGGYANIATRGGASVAGGTLVVGSGSAGGLASNYSIRRASEIFRNDGSIALGSGETVELDSTGPFSSVEVTNNGDGTVSYSGYLTAPGSRVRRRVETTVCVAEGDCDND